MLRVCNGIIDAFGRGAIGPLLGARRKDMPGIFADARRGSGPIAPDPRGTGRISARAASRTAHGGRTPPRRPLLTLAQIRSRQMYR